MYFELITPDKKAFEGEVIGVKMPGVNGSFEVLNNHAPIISNLEKGELRVTASNEQKFFEIESGIVEVLNNKIVVLTETVQEK
ncbi:F0F1 ATP synthase subunit epsilon [Chondrinema litorale]|uniref:F0F1 ATP synthase subunit epsilon n=1 Tax=Chondrinema litorale TaxID=2994555 RepID=UPI002543A61C|nr:F0F1 ATP synthase subunit epsilon [Chondrinema litorale]UZR95527.1 F0F1 ATP synthase subunit epsilon [Chondrinema litorale]